MTDTVVVTELENGIVEVVSSGPQGPSGLGTSPAGGVLSGNYPNPGFAVDMATQAELDAVSAAKQSLSGKDASGGYPGLTLFKLNLRNAADTFTSWFTTAATAARTWVMPDKDGTVAMTVDITGGTSAGSFTSLTSSGNAALGDAEASDTHAIKGATTLLANSASAALTVTQTGSGNAFVVEDSASADSTPLVIDASGRVGIGVSAPATGLHYDAVSGDAYVLVRGDTAARMHIRRYGTDANAAAFGLYKGRGTIAVPTMVASGDRLGDFTTYGYDGTQHVAAARIYVEVDDTPGTNDMPGRLVLSTTADGASSPTERMRVDSAGLITARNSTGLGYGAGSGGTVTQATSKATAVTLNKPSGQITTDNASLAAGATVSFTWNNSLFTATDTVVTSMKTGYGTFGSYSLEVENVSAGSATVVIKNNTGGSLSEAFTFSFAVIKGSTT